MQDHGPARNHDQFHRVDRFRKGYEKSSKHRKVEALIEKGAEIQILSESDFSELMGVELP